MIRWHARTGNSCTWFLVPWLLKWVMIWIKFFVFLGKSSREPDHKRRGTTRGPISEASGWPRLLNYITQSVILIHSTLAEWRFRAVPIRAVACSSFNTLLITKAIIDYPTGCRCSSSCPFLSLARNARRVICLFNFAATAIQCSPRSSWLRESMTEWRCASFGA